jgi:hypothetical protein
MFLGTFNTYRPVITSGRGTDMKPRDLSKLSREEKLALLDEIEEKEKRDKRKRSAYVPNSLQQKVHASLRRIRLVTSANGVGKTCLGVQEAYSTATLGAHPLRLEAGGAKLPVPNKGAIVLDAPDKVDRWLEEFNKWYDTSEWQFLKHGKPYITEIQLPNGSNFVFLFHLQEPMAFESFECDYAIMDEPPPRHAFVGLQRALRRSDYSWSLIVGTPLAQAWMKKDLYDPCMKGERDDIEVFKAGILVNEANLGKNYITNFSKDLTEHEKRVRLHGDFAHLEGLALAEYWKPEHHLVEPFDWPRQWPCVVAIDFHPAKPCTAVLLGVNKLDEFYILKTFKSKSPPRVFAEELREWYAGYKLQDIVCDSLGSTPKTGGIDNMSFIEVLNKNRVPVRPTSFKEKKEDVWVKNIQDLLVVRETKLGPRPGLYIFSSCREIINEVESVQWSRNRHGEEMRGSLDIGNKDLLSCLKYALASPPMLSRIAEVYSRPKPSYASRK